MKHKEVFDVSKLPIPEYALFLGLAVPPRVQFLQKKEKQPTKILSRSPKTEETQPWAPTLTNDCVENFRAYLSEKMSILQKSGKVLERTEYRLANGSRDGEQEEEEEEEDEVMEEKLSKATGLQTECVPKVNETQKVKEVPVRFLDRNDEEEDEPDADFVMVKQCDMFGLYLKENKALHVSLFPMMRLVLSFLHSACLWGTQKKQKQKQVDLERWLSGNNHTYQEDGQKKQSSSCVISALSAGHYLLLWLMKGARSSEAEQSQGDCHADVT
uniref:probable ATP-dependent RNA helicase DDX10 isoform X1 n=1 Tax=Jaculus jaculus TaxID=51337 RepID=UPI001E1B1954|nr:probable ATP-dependent RNA helicase DDX10 isoform X1 [Jaculus jaculus]XP_045002470.1 probable ATP-dependent RNA helicase DDX10 isoform X1 [Jaculus jaculus]XP_045002472.1 probable ATP-dependent RNA helicase DDX10 isoform X1 [Jaculus jaculus]XP_045002473.1 probable ATP-dependent RNA helicase DDX10 isoform X1 [Jaculus jaculus]XP_045002474.1 probable ATP-dependent RNA helicase DDX10 isoform X1 [Jaculus jaculus]XP_045002475.1 probable ATP-dependent RNA helicase DDX10 isoform X1 [Jaculus jaculus]